MTKMSIDVEQELSAFGAVSADTRMLDQESHLVANYLDLIWRLGPGTTEPDVPRPIAVVEADGRPILYVVRANSLSGNKQVNERNLIRLRNIIACRGEGAYVGVLRPGQLTVYRRGFTAASDGGEDFFASAESQFVIRDLSVGSAPPKLQEVVDAKALHDLLFDLMVGVSKELRRSRPLRNDDGAVLALVGRALFARFLVDRYILTPETLPEAFDLAGSPICFATPKMAAKTCQWMDATFNGDLLPLPSGNYESYFASLQTRDNVVFCELSKIVERTEHSGQRILDWGWLNFAHIPVGILSEVYEDYAHEFFKKLARKESIRYTPRHLAEFMINEAFEGLPEDDRYKARVLDPTAGGGVFLVLALRRLFVERWKKFGRPTTHDLQNILLEQICGFDINPHALTLAAFSLHLTTIELEPTPTSPRDLRFVKLEGVRLLSARKQNEDILKYPVLGSLGEAIGGEHDGRYDITIGNPPWTAWEGPEGKNMNAYATSVTQRVSSGRLPLSFASDIQSYSNPDNNPDLPFVWRCMEWVKPGGIIALAMHGRLIFKRSEPGIKARDLLFRCLRVTGILNGGGLHSSIWPGMSQPFCVLFAKNVTPKRGDVFLFVSAERDELLNRIGFMRIDPDTAEPVDNDVLVKKPYLLKTLFRGTALDADLIERLNGLMVFENSKPRLAPRLQQYWIPRSGLYSGVGYQKAGKTKGTSEIRRLRPKDLTTDDDLGYLIDPRQLEDFSHQNLHRPRKPGIYKTPLVIVKAAIGEDAKQIRARLALGKIAIAYNESFYGSSTHGHPQAANMARYLFLLLNSDLYVYYILMTSSKFGVERRAALTEDIKEFPIVPLELLAKKDRGSIPGLVDGFKNNPEAALRRLNNWVFTIYGLTNADRQIVHDALSTQMPYADTHQRAEAPPTTSEINSYRQKLEDHLQPFFDLTDETISVRVVDAQSYAWKFLSVTTGSDSNLAKFDNDAVQILQALADHHGCSRVFIERGEGGLILGILSQSRYWTATRARLCALHILRHFSHRFPVTEQHPA